MVPGKQYRHVRDLRSSDLALLKAWDQDSEITELSGRRFDDAATMNAWWEDLFSNRMRLGLAIVADCGALIGDIEFEQMVLYSREAELRISIGDKSYWNRGIGTRALAETIDFAQNIGIRRIYLRVKKDNRRAIRVYQKNGFKKVAKLVANGHLQGRSDLLLMEVAMSQDVALKA